jgi:hypothetical protein
MSYVLNRSTVPLYRSQKPGENFLSCRESPCLVLAKRSPGITKGSNRPYLPTAEARDFSGGAR